MYKVLNNLIPSFFVNMFTVNSAIDNYNTRQKKQFTRTQLPRKGERAQRERLWSKNVE